MQPKVTVILSTYNNPRYLSGAIKSVITQSYREWELIVINDASPFAITKEIIGGFKDERIKYIENTYNIGNVQSAVNAMQIAQGEYIARIDDDDEWISPEKLRMQVEYLDSHPDDVLVGSNIVVTDYDTDAEIYTTTYPLVDEEIRRNFFKASPFAHSSVMFRKNKALEVGGYDASLRRIEDYDLWLKLGTIGKMHNFSEALVLWRSPSKQRKNKRYLRLYDHLVKLGVLWRHRNQYAGFWIAFVIAIAKIPPYTLLALF